MSIDNENRSPALLLQTHWVTCWKYRILGVRLESQYLCELSVFIPIFQKRQMSHRQVSNLPRISLLEGSTARFWARHPTPECALLTTEVKTNPTCVFLMLLSRWLSFDYQACLPVWVLLLLLLLLFSLEPEVIFSRQGLLARLWPGRTVNGLRGGPCRPVLR